MMSDNQTTIGQIAEVFDGPHATPKKIDTGPYFLSISSLSNGALDLNQSAHLSEDDFKKWTKRVTPEHGDVLFSYETRLGEAALMPSGVRACLGRRMGLLRPDRTKVIPEYLLYAYLAPEFQRTIEARKIHGATVDRIALKELPSFPVRIPELSEQKAVVEILERLDAKIQLNHQINQTLEQMAQAIFKSWFVDFEPVKAKITTLDAGGTEEDAVLAAMQVISGKVTDQLAQMQAEQPKQYAELRATAELFPSAMQDSELGEIPERWGVSNVDKTTSLIIDHRGKTPKKLGGDWSHEGFTALSAKHIKGGKIVNREQLRFVDSELYHKWMKDELLEGDVLLTSEGPMGEMYYLASDKKYCLSQRLYSLRANDQLLSPSYFYFWMNSSIARSDMEGRATGTTVVGIRQSELRKVKVLLPSHAITMEFHEAAQNLLKASYRYAEQSESLAEIRDTLLPKLMSGELTMPGTEESKPELQDVAHV